MIVEALPFKANENDKMFSNVAEEARIEIDVEAFKKSTRSQGQFKNLSCFGSVNCLNERTTDVTSGTITRIQKECVR